MNCRPNIHKLRRRSQRLAAFSLVEVMMSLAIVGSTLVTFYIGVGSGFAVVQLFRENLRATQVMTEKMETIRLYTFDQVSSNGFIPASFTAPLVAGAALDSSLTFTGAVTIGPFDLPDAPSYAGDLAVVTVNLSWVSGGVPRQRSMKSLVARNGLQTYIY